MEYREIVAVTGLGGLYQLLSTKSDGAIVRNLADMSTKFISARLHNVTPLESIEVYTTGANVRLHEVLAVMLEQEAAKPLVNAKADNSAIQNYFVSVFPEIDIDRVYVSDMKKILKWYDLLKANNLLNFEKVNQEEEAQEQAAETPAELVAEEKPAKKAAKAKAETTEATDGEEKPAKKARAKKAVAADAAEGEEKPKKVARKKKTEEE
ncbi:MAG: DUF5606 domain-containing protein [Bacteroidetes bacterium]|nr:DUF5606 domain-containing protein [Bacteroidota bacterium]